MLLYHVTYTKKSYTLKNYFFIILNMNKILNYKFLILLKIKIEVSEILCNSIRMIITGFMNKDISSQIGLVLEIIFQSQNILNLITNLINRL